MKLDEALRLMSKGHEIEATTGSGVYIIHMKNGELFVGEDTHLVYLDGWLSDESTTFKIVKKLKDWCLKDELPFNSDLDAEACINKCKELILKDCTNLYNDGCLNSAIGKVIRQRFG